MIKEHYYKYLFYIIFILVISILLFVSNTLSISYKEALNVFINQSMLSYITKSSIYFFGQNDFALRFPFIAFYILSVILMFLITKNYFKYEFDRLISIVLFMSLPGLLSAALLVNSAVVVTFCTLLYIFYYQKTNKHCYILLVLFLFVDNSFAILFFALFFYARSSKDKTLLIVSFLLFILSMYIYGFDTGGKPRGFFLNIFAIYASIFSPLLFIYFFYSMYKIGIKGEKNLTWHICMSALFLSFLFSFRQYIPIEDYAPYIIIAIPLMVKLFFHTLRIRLPQFRLRHYVITFFVLLVLMVNIFLTLFNKPIYLILDNPKKHFAFQYHFIKELASLLKKNNINNIEFKDKNLALRLKFYGINEGTKYLLSKKELASFDKKLVISYHKKDLFTVYLIKQ